ncbi:PREDICTED: tumor suppressor candidate 5 homolog [Amphimedon queenslandica]|uniref:Uncharacterized protein n=1 Tax=Amphimedon queenslandica TaxID=400682 RepID=A0AAN0J0Z0_AMPQE|nr:PREDICTED: tumor suppressor candidate 5 homolog [Amphimedon queenslandica]|eukprot:XP_019850386.1 PREDICTED: tumor suppressor candidate 5 homolog [Amphimedon queenslandica]
MDSDQSLQNYQPPTTGYAPAPQNFKNEDPLPDKPQDGYGYTPISEPQKQTNNSAIVVISQPTPTIATRSVISRDLDDSHLRLSIICIILSCFCGTWPVVFLFSVPAFIFSLLARHAEARGNIRWVQIYSCLALGCNIVGLVSGVILILTVIILIIVW